MVVFFKKQDQFLSLLEWKKKTSILEYYTKKSPLTTNMSDNCFCCYCCLTKTTLALLFSSHGLDKIKEEHVRYPIIKLPCFLAESNAKRSPYFLKPFLNQPAKSPS